MGTTQKYSLKWNDFGVNVASTFRDLHSRHDFVDVTLACSDGSTLEAHKVILSSVSSYFRDILKTTPCKHPIIILKDTCRDEAEAMLEFAYTGEVNVGQDLLPSLLSTARSFKIKGLDKVENPIEPPPPPMPTAQQPTLALPPGTAVVPWALKTSPVRAHSPRSIHSQQDVKPLFFTNETKAHQQPILKRPQREASPMASAPPSRNSSRPPTRESSPCPSSHANGSSAASRTPPPKRWKRSFDMTAQPESNGQESKEEPLPMIAENYSSNRNEYDPSKRFFETSSSSSGRSAPYPHSMPTSPTMFERGNETRLAGLFRHHLANTDAGQATPAAASSSQSPTRSEQQQQLQQQLQQRRESLQRPESTTTNGHSPTTSTPVALTTHQMQAATNGGSDYDPVDYRCYTKNEPNGAEFNNCNGRQPEEDEESRKYRRGSLIFRPESAPTVLDMSPDNSMSGPPSVRNMDMCDSHRDDDHEDDLSDCVSKAFSITPDAMGRYSCDECGKIFKHPGSLQHHRHIHRGTHRCPSCGKAFSRRWDMERHLNKSKYGCPANRFSTGSNGSSSTSSQSGERTVSSATVPPSSLQSAAHLQLLSAAAVTANGIHNTTA